MRDMPRLIALCQSASPPAMTHPFFDDLRTAEAKLATGKDMPPLFNFTREGRSFLQLTASRSRRAKETLLTNATPAELSIRPDLIRQLVPSHCEAELASRGIDVNNFEPIPLADMRITLEVNAPQPWKLLGVSRLTPSRLFARHPQ